MFIGSEAKIYHSFPLHFLKMTPSCSNKLLLLLPVLLMLLFSLGFGRKITYSFQQEHEVEEGIAREMMELDYAYAEPNTNVRSGYAYVSPTPSPPPPPPPPPPPSLD